MTAVEVLHEARRLGIKLTPNGDRLRYRGPPGVITRDLLTELKRHKPDLIALLSSSRETHACTRCHRFAFPQRGVVCYWCRSTPEASA